MQENLGPESQGHHLGGLGTAKEGKNSRDIVDKSLRYGSAKSKQEHSGFTQDLGKAVLGTGRKLEEGLWADGGKEGGVEEHEEWAFMCPKAEERPLPQPQKFLHNLDNSSC